jgi:hypothetical protein
MSISQPLLHARRPLVCCIALGVAGCGSAQSGDEGKIAGFAFVDSSVTGQGSRATLPQGTKIYPPGSKITGTDGCPSTQYRTDGLIVAVIDYASRPTAGSVTVSLVPAPQFGQRPPYQLDLNTGRTLQFLGPIFENGTYQVTLEYFFGQAKTQSTFAQFTLDRRCRG